MLPLLPHDTLVTTPMPLPYLLVALPLTEDLTKGSLELINVQTIAAILIGFLDKQTKTASGAESVVTSGMIIPCAVT